MANSEQIILALDYGDSRIGMATASVAARLPAPSDTLKTSDDSPQEIADYIEQNHVKALVIGLPRGLDGQETAQTGIVRAFGAKMAIYTTIPIFYQDEALTSHKALAELQDRGVRYTKEDVDALAATYILSDFLAAHPEV